MPDYRLELNRHDGSDPEIVPHYDSEVAFRARHGVARARR
jgi:hypothetical protein